MNIHDIQATSQTKNLFIMKTKNLFFLFAFVFLFSFQSCVKDKCQREVTYIKDTPVYLTLEEIRGDINMTDARELEEPGKIYFYNDYIFINEKRSGVHIFDNTQPENPINIGFLNIPGNVDIAIRNNTLFADSYIDLLAIDISSVTNPVLVKRSENVFPSLGDDPEKGILVYIDSEEVTEMIDCNSSEDEGGWANDDIGAPEVSFDNEANSGGDGTGGSLARFSLYDDFLYAIDQSNMYTFSISDLSNPAKVGEMNVGWNIETLYAFGDKLFIGSQQGMFIYDAVDPANPQYISGYEHWTSCDPVFVKDNYAYVTLRSGTFCNGGEINQLDLIDITDILNPFLVKSFPMDNPHGLSIKDDNLLLCEGESGLKLFDIAEPLNLDENQLSLLDGLSAKDVIVLPGNRNIALVVGDDGFYQVDFNTPENLETLSYIPVK